MKYTVVHFIQDKPTSCLSWACFRCTVVIMLTAK